jgi:hypothetical protein
MDTDTTTGDQRSENLWFNDGTIVLRAEKTIFRVYAGLLASQSSVFKDMLEFPQPSGSSETIEGCPVVTLHDSAQDLQNFLRVLHESW